MKCVGTNTTLSDPPTYCKGYRGSEYGPSISLPPAIPGAVDQCPNGQVCMDFVSSASLGICCPAPGKMALFWYYLQYDHDYDDHDHDDYDHDHEYDHHVFF